MGNGSSVDVLAAGYSGGVASAGTQYVDLIGGGAPVFPSGLLQTIHLTPGQHQLSFDYNGSGGTLDYSFGSLISGSASAAALNNFTAFGSATPWQTITQTFAVALEADYSLSFSTPAGAFGGPYIDNVALVAVPEPVEYAAVAGLALVAFGAWRRARR